MRAVQSGSKTSGSAQTCQPGGTPARNAVAGNDSKKSCLSSADGPAPPLPPACTEPPEASSPELLQQDHAAQERSSPSSRRAAWRLPGPAAAPPPSSTACVLGRVMIHAGLHRQLSRSFLCGACSELGCILTPQGGKRRGERSAAATYFSGRPATGGHLDSGSMVPPRNKSPARLGRRPRSDSCLRPEALERSWNHNTIVAY